MDTDLAVLINNSLYSGVEIFFSWHQYVMIMKTKWNKKKKKYGPRCINWN